MEERSKNSITLLWSRSGLFPGRPIHQTQRPATMLQRAHQEEARGGQGLLSPGPLHLWGCLLALGWASTHLPRPHASFTLCSQCRGHILTGMHIPWASRKLITMSGDRRSRIFFREDHRGLSITEAQPNHLFRPLRKPQRELW